MVLVARLDTAAANDEFTRNYVQQLEKSVIHTWATAEGATGVAEALSRREAASGDTPPDAR